MHIAWNVSPAPIPPVRARSQPKTSDGKNTARRAGARIGPSLFLTSVLFAIGHIATIREPARLAVFFPSLVFGWLRARTGGIGAGLTFHAMCNVYSELLGKGYHVY